MTSSRSLHSRLPPFGGGEVCIQMCASLTDAQIDFALETFEKAGKKLGVV